MEFCSFEEAIAVPWKTLPKGVSEIFLAMSVAENFEATHRRNVGKLSATDFQNLKTFKDVLCDKQQFNHNHISSATLEKLTGITACNIHSIVGAILAQDILKVKFGEQKPIHNFYHFDGEAAEGTLLQIGC
ncbi:SUMO-activating enzyme subunit 1B-1-like [Capsicum annuum]|uniref:SUMO-activating enzyme subunit 1B-1-like n=1 Tax=Capsicum annuum TaxID=4072 RepID=UPI001FB13E19|nr:SUMO-activating enzyme subunit 1B-1-like [Capsicum annuum]